MVQEKKKNMDEATEKKGRMQKEEDERASTHKTTGKPSNTPNKNDSSGSRKSR